MRFFMRASLLFNVGQQPRDQNLVLGNLTCLLFQCKGRLAASRAVKLP